MSKWLRDRDGCSLFPDGDYGGCCVEHDTDYRTGRVPRAVADKKLRECVHKAGHHVLCWVIWAGVRVFGVFSYKRLQS